EAFGFFERDAGESAGLLVDVDADEPLDAAFGLFAFAGDFFQPSAEMAGIPAEELVEVLLHGGGDAAAADAEEHVDGPGNPGGVGAGGDGRLERCDAEGKDHQAGDAEDPQGGGEVLRE